VTALRSDGSEFPASLAIGRIDGHSPPHFVGFLRDLSERGAHVKRQRHRSRAGHAARHASGSRTSRACRRWAR
jgi:hypothetical protein